MRRFAVFSSLFQASDYSLRTLDILVQTSHLLSRQIGQALFLYEGLSLDGKVTPYLHFRKFSGRTQIWQDLACSSNFKGHYVFTFFACDSHGRSSGSSRVHVKSSLRNPSSS
jgi:hypothetical protein